MPAPICPAPMTPTVSILTAMFLPSKRRRPAHDHRRAAMRVQSRGLPFFITPNRLVLRRSCGARASKDAPDGANRRLLEHPSRPVAFGNGRLRMRAVETPITEDPLGGYSF